ncbi:hypothetical protein EG68_01079 [Paragonimus skrjabini miyazakii]|uniref:Uncharacterized protein n=1 Tax=Paragonimus skrjabini miyazakii TaxID=59628 RepID=A0A8S9Z800_9TREM|nr:hypothetical protein EG68_01079 [Paragonimus skrjabini miyazakii]
MALSTNYYLTTGPGHVAEDLIVRNLIRIADELEDEWITGNFTLDANRPLTRPCLFTAQSPSVRQCNANGTQPVNRLPRQSIDKKPVMRLSIFIGFGVLCGLVVIRRALRRY